MGGDRPNNQGGYNRGAGFNPRALVLRRGCRASRLDAETRTSDLCALMLRRGSWALAPWCWNAGLGPSRLDAETRVLSPCALMLRRGSWTLAPWC